MCYPRVPPNPGTGASSTTGERVEEDETRFALRIVGEVGGEFEDGGRGGGTMVFR